MCRTLRLISLSPVRPVRRRRFTSTYSIGGDARPDMTYNLLVFGLVHPMVISRPGPITRRVFSSQQLTASPSRGTVSWSIVGGNPPPGLTVSTNGVLSGTATTDGSYSFTLQASDTGPPAQVVTGDVTMVAEPVKINFSGTMTDACANQPYSFQIPTTGGTQPFTWFFRSAPDKELRSGLSSRTRPIAVIDTEEERTMKRPIMAGF